MRNPKSVYILGAGCTNNYIDGRNPGISELDIPLDKNFLSVSAKILLHRAREYDYVKYFHDLVKEIEMQFFTFDDKRNMFESIRDRKDPFLPLINNIDEITEYEERCKFLIDNPISLERVFTILDSQVNDNFLQKSSYLDDLIRLIGLTLDLSLRGAPCNLHLELAKKLQKDDVIISYNYDILMDNALLSIPNFYEKGYNVPFHYVVDNGDYSRPSSKSSEIEILKLHGSLNWIECRKCRCTILSKRQKMGADINIRNITCPSCNQKELHNMIIPPVLNKRLDILPYRRLWEIAFNKMIHSDRIVVIGYRLPETDFISEAMFRAATHFMIHDRKLEIVNPNYLQIKNRLSNVFNTKNVECYYDLKGYLRGEKKT